MHFIKVLSILQLINECTREILAKILWFRKDEFFCEAYRRTYVLNKDINAEFSRTSLHYTFTLSHWSRGNI